MTSIHPSTEPFPMRISIQSRECSTAVLERLPGSTLFPERPIGAAIVSALHRPQGSVICVAAPGMVEADDQIEYFLRLGMATTRQVDPRPPRDRVTVLSIEDQSSRWLSEKLLDVDHPDAVAACEHLRAAVERERRAGRNVMLNYFEPSARLERLADCLGVVGDQAPSWAIPLGTKASGRDIFRALQIPVAAATAPVRNLGELAAAMEPLVHEGRRRFVLKLDSTEYGAGMGNAFFDIDEEMAADLPAAIAACLPHAQVVDPKFGWSGFSAAVPQAGVLAEELITGEEFRSPSVQGKLTPDGPQIVSTHEQVLAPNRQTYTGSVFPAAEPYRMLIAEYGQRVGKALHDKGINCGDYGVDFIVVSRNGRWHVFACELNLRATGTRHGFDMVTNLLGTTPDLDGELHVDGERRVYFASDSITSERYVGLRPRALIEAVERSPLHYDPARQQGVILHLLSTLPRYGKFGAICVADSAEVAERMMEDLRVIALNLSDKCLVLGAQSESTDSI